MDYYKRMINELIDLTSKIVLLDNYLEKIDKSKPLTEIFKNKVDLMEKQLDIMVNYRSVLLDRIFLEIDDVKSN